MPGPIKPQKKLYKGGCGIAALAMLLHLPQTRVAEAAKGNLIPDTISAGMFIREIQEVSARLGHPLTTRRVRNLDNLPDLGILSVFTKKWQHVIVVFNGTSAIDPDDGTLWDVEEFLNAHKAKPGMVLTEIS